MLAEFMGFRRGEIYSETKLEQALIDNLEKFIMELGRGFAFVERQQHIVTETADFYIDLVFYNFKMKRFVLFELKTRRLMHQDIVFRPLAQTTYQGTSVFVSILSKERLS